MVNTAFVALQKVCKWVMIEIKEIHMPCNWSLVKIEKAGRVTTKESTPAMKNITLRVTPNNTTPYTYTLCECFQRT